MQTLLWRKTNYCIKSKVKKKKKKNHLHCCTQEQELWNCKSQGVNIFSQHFCQPSENTKNNIYSLSKQEKEPNSCMPNRENKRKRRENNKSMVKMVLFKTIKMLPVFNKRWVRNDRGDERRVIGGEIEPLIDGKGWAFGKI